jgi:hypothetical protein
MVFAGSSFRLGGRHAGEGQPSRCFDFLEDDRLWMQHPRHKRPGVRQRLGVLIGGDEQ